MVEPVIITIGPDLVGLNQIALSQFSGYNLLVQVSVIGTLNDDAVEVLPTGGFKLKGTKTFQLMEVYTIIPVTKSITSPISAPFYSPTQYPHSMVLTKVGSSSQDTNGNWQSTGSTVEERACRAEPNSKNAFITTADGTQVYFDYTLYMPLPAETVAVGTKVEVFDGLDILSTGTVKRFSRGQLNARAWI